MPILLNTKNFTGNIQSIVETAKGHFLNGQYYTKDFEAIPLLFLNHPTMHKNISLNKLASQNNGTIHYANRTLVNLDREHILVDNIDPSISYNIVRNSNTFQIVKMHESDDGIEIVHETDINHTSHSVVVSSLATSWVEFAGFLGQNSDKIFFATQGTTNSGSTTGSSFKIMSYHKTTGEIVEIQVISALNGLNHGMVIGDNYIYSYNGTKSQISKLDEITGTVSLVHEYTQGQYIKHPSYEKTVDGIIIYDPQSDSSINRINIDANNIVTVTKMNVISTGIEKRNAGLIATVQSCRLLKFSNGVNNYLVNIIHTFNRTDVPGYVQVMKIEGDNLTIVNETIVPVFNNGYLTSEDGMSIYINGNGKTIYICEFDIIDESYKVSKTLTKTFNAFGLSKEGSLYIDNVSGVLEKYTNDMITDINITFEKKSYRYKVDEINTLVKISAKNYLNKPVSSMITLDIEGNALFDDNTKHKDVMMTGEEMTVPIKIVGPGMISIIPKVKL